MANRPTEYLALDELLSEEERLVRDTVREWVEDRVLPHIGKHFQEGRFPRELVPEMAELGMLGPYLPPEYGGAGVGFVSYGLVMQELERGDTGIRSFASVQGSLCMFPIFAYGSEEQKRRWLLAMAEGRVIGCYGLTEPDGGSDPWGNMRTRATPDGDGFVLSGTKMWITNANICDVAVVWAKVREEGKDTVRGFLVERGLPGFDTRPVPPKLSLRASDTGELIMDEVRLPRSAMLPGVRGLKGPLSCLTEARYGIAWGGIGAASACYEEALDFASERVTFGAPVSSRQLVQQKLVNMLSDILKGQLMCWRVGRLKEQGRATPGQVSLIKRDCVWIGLQAARQARDILGASGVTTEYSAMRHMCNLESVRTYEGTHDIHTLVVGGEITGHRAFGC